MKSQKQTDEYPDPTKPTTIFHELIEQFAEKWDASGLAGKDDDVLCTDCNKTRLVAGTIILDIFWYPLSNELHRNWYTVKINSINNSARFIGKTEEFGKSMDIFQNILIIADITTKSVPQ
jgi:hypothetical protein